jgi:hypothetical protein
LKVLWDDPGFLNDLYDLYILQNIPQIPRPSPEAIKTIIDQMAETDPRVASLRPEQLIDGRFFQELEKEGFIQRLWRRVLQYSELRSL